MNNTTRVYFEGEYKLLHAILENAIEDFLGHKATQKEQKLAKLWFLSKDSSYVYSFESVCSYLNLSSNAIRRKLSLIPDDGNAFNAPRTPVAGFCVNS